MRLLMFLDFSQCGVTCKYGKKVSKYQYINGSRSAYHARL